jgi:hypothetical protein
MILARLSRAVREQNWFAVVLEFFIVVAGVLLAFQVSSWSSEAGQRAYARDILARLDTELTSISAVRRNIVASRTERLSALLEARPIIMGMMDGETLTAEQCRAIAISGDVGRAPDSLPSLDELLQSGALESIDSPQLRRAAMELYSKRDAVRASADQGASRAVNLAVDYPQAVRQTLVRDLDEEDDGWDTTAECDLDAMQSSSAFQAAFLENVRWYRGNVEFIFIFLDEAIETLQAAIDDELDRNSVSPSSEAVP